MASLVIVCILLAGAVVAVVFSGLFFAHLVIESIREKKAKEQQAIVVAEPVAEKEEEEKKDEIEEIDLDEMLATLEKRAQESEKEEAEEVVEPVVEEVVEETAEEEKEEEEKPQTVAPVVIVMNQGAKEEPVVEDEKQDLNYEERLAQAREAFAKIEKDYGKNTKALNKYKRTERKKARNEKLLNKKAAELASLNLSIYNVKDLKDIDPDKKAKQEELTTHVAELKASILEAEEYLEANKEKHAHDVKLNAYLEKEHARYEEEIKSLEEFLKKNDEE